MKVTKGSVRRTLIAVVAAGGLAAWSVPGLAESGPTPPAGMGPGMMGGYATQGAGEPGAQGGYGSGYGYGMGPGMMYGYGPGYGMGPGMMYGYRGGYGPVMMGGYGYGMGPGMMGAYGMGPGMMYGYGRGMMGGYGMGRGMMGGYGGGYGPGMMGGYGYGMGPGMMHGYGPGMMGGYGMGRGMRYGYGPGMMGGYGYGMDPGMMYGYGMGPGMMYGYGPAYGALDLSDEQGTKIEKIYSEARQKQWDLGAKLFAAHTKLREALAAEKPDRKAVASAYKALSDLRLQRLELRLDTRAKVDAVLTKEQREQLQNWRAGWMGPWH